MNDWKHIKNVFERSIVDISKEEYKCYDYYEWENCYKKQRFRLVDKENYSKLINSLKIKYYKYYKSSSWLKSEDINDIFDDSNKFFKKRYMFY